MRKSLLPIIVFLTSLSLYAKPYKGAEVQTKRTFHYGRFETRFYSSDISGMLSTFFLFENDGYKPCCKWQEIDVEVFGKGDANSWQSNPIYQTDGAGDRIVAEEVHELANDGHVDEFHVYIVDWTPDFIKWYVDGQLIRSFTDTAALKIIGEKPMLAMFNHWTSKWLDWTGPFNGNEAPSYQMVDYFKVYDWVSDSTFKKKPSFQDDFDKDLSKWNISTHTFDGNLCDFTTENVALRDGKLILAFTREGETGVAENFNINGSINIKKGEWVDKIDYPYTLNKDDGLINMYLFEGDRITFYDEKGVFVKKAIIENGAVSTTELNKGWYYFIISSKPKVLRKIEKE